jgi:hypothetical protein
MRRRRAEQYKRASLSFLFSGRLPAPLETTIRGGFRVKMWAFGLDGLVPLEPLELGVRQDLAILVMTTPWVVGNLVAK